ncbi:putative ABC transporter ATP-binding protein [Corynebacterium provencense]|uniref:Putative ABC transporter ATP-binding protein n=1 Tax=Corynebacterium provencense TaxID=1737425 RepID=A0A2Z3YQZ2_9CORY|nr:ABC transporter ATP-binding protein [Corynebacterium provencense]AWT27266.1 putative ABC transporter ATP-binding protein [Corynebacterium provencense]
MSVNVAARLPEASVPDTARAARALLRPYLRPLSGAAVLLAAGATAGLGVPALQGRIVDDVIAGNGPGRLAVTVALVLVTGVCAALLVLWGGRILVRALQSALADLREQVVDAAVRLDAGLVESAGSGDIVSRVTGDVESVTGAVTEVLPRSTQAVVTLLVTAAGFAVLDPLTGLAALTVLPVQLFAGRRFLRRSRPLYVRQQRTEAERGQALIESVTGAATVRAHAVEPARLALIASRSLAAVEIGRAATKVRNGFNAGLNTAEFLGLAAVLAVGFRQVEAGVLTVGAATTGALFFQRFFAPVSDLLAGVDDLQRAEVGLARLVGVLQVPVDAAPATPVAGAGVQLREVSFAYPSLPPSLSLSASESPAVPAPVSAPASGAAGRTVLDRVTLTVPDGARVVLVGASGSGKSTVARLIAGALRPTSGEVLVGGVPAQEAASSLPPGSPAVLLVTQEIHRFSGSVADNLRLVAPTATDAELLAATDAVGAGWVRILGLDSTDVLDEAQVQQLALARVLLADPPVVVLDEATAHAGTDDRLDAAVDAVTRDRTSVIVAHRLSQAARADLVVVLDGGRIVESGTHGTLIAAKGRYARLWAASTPPSSPCAPRPGAPSPAGRREAR